MYLLEIIELSKMKKVIVYCKNKGRIMFDRLNIKESNPLKMNCSSKSEQFLLKLYCIPLDIFLVYSTDPDEMLHILSGSTLFTKEQVYAFPVHINQTLFTQLHETCKT